MFDNGNFRRKRKRKSDGSSTPSSSVSEKTDGTKTADAQDALKTTSPGATSPPEQQPSTAPSSTPCLSGFFSTMTTYVNGPSAMSRPVVPPGLGPESADKMGPNPVNFSTYTPLTNLGSHVGPFANQGVGAEWANPEPTNTLGYGGSALSQVSPPFYHSANTNNVFYPREDSDV